MVDRIQTNRPDVVAVQSAPRPTPAPVRVSFKDTLARVGVQVARTAMNVLPGAPLVATALRGPAITSPLGPMSPLAGHVGASPSAVSMAPEGPGAAGAGAPGGDPTGSGSIDAALAQSAEENMYFLQLQERVNSENRSYTALSNILKEEHDTHKAAINNIRA